MIVTHRALHTWERAVDLFITPSQFAKGKYVEAGFDQDRIVVKPNFLEPDPGYRDGSGNYFAYVGRLSSEKGIELLLKAWRQARPEAKLRIAGAGPLEDVIRAAACADPSIEFLGKVSLSQVVDIMGGAVAVIVPSQWHEPFGRVVVESFAVGTPVIATAIGGLAELVDPERNGMLCAWGDPNALARAIARIDAQRGFARRMRSPARTAYESRFRGRQNLEMLLAAYNLARHRSETRAKGFQLGAG
jgi:glycosyltransferase involved in cell wall biosynthesis